MNSNLIFSIIQSFSVVIASSVAIYGITSWRREAKWKRKYELAEEVLSLFYECKEKIAIIRNPVSYSVEGKTRKKSNEESEVDTARLNSAYVSIERYENEKEPFLKLRVLKFRSMVILGKESGESFDEITKILNLIFYSARSLGEIYWKNQGHKNFSDVEFQKHLNEMHEREANIWSSYNENDTIDNRIDKCIFKIEDFCKSVIVI